jgi:hypothetical protein
MRLGGDPDAACDAHRRIAWFADTFGQGTGIGYAICTGGRSVLRCAGSEPRQDHWRQTHDG